MHGDCYPSLMVEADPIAFEEVRPLTRAEYHRLAEAGAFEDERVELLRGVLVKVSPQGEPHAQAVQRLNELLVLGLSKRAWVRPQLPFAASDVSEPEPDLSVVPRDYATDDHPAEAALVIEVAHSSLRRDQRLKAGIYAENGVPEYWIVDLRDQVIEVRSRPERGAYRERRTAERGEALTVPGFPDVEVRVDEVLDRPA